MKKSKSQAQKTESGASGAHAEHDEMKKLDIAALQRARKGR